MSVTLGNVVVQDLTYTARQLGQRITINYLNGGVAGAESVSVSGSTINVTIASGTSTASQIKTAVETCNESNFLVSVAVSGTGSTAQVTCKNASLSGGHAAVKASAQIGHILYTAHTAGTSGNSTTIQYVGDTAFSVVTVTDGTNLEVDDTTGLIVGDTIVQGNASATIATVTDSTNIEVDDTTGWDTGAASTAVADGSEVVGVSSSAVTIRMKDGVSTAAHIMAAVAALSAASTLLDTSSNSPSAPQLKASAAVATSLSGGLAAAAPATVVQDLTIAADATGTSSNGDTFSYTTGATAGSEVVTVTSGVIGVQIENGVSTATQIAAALNAETDFTSVYNVTVSGTGANAQSTVNGAQTSAQSSTGTRSFYQDSTGAALTTSYQVAQFPSAADTIDVYNDEASGAKVVIVSLDGSNEQYLVKATEHLHLEAVNGVGCLSLKRDSNGAPAYRLEVMCK